MGRRHGKGNTPKLPSSTITSGGKAGMGRCECPSPLSLVDRPVASINPLNEQFAPTEECAIPQRSKMGGMA